MQNADQYRQFAQALAAAAESAAPETRDLLLGAARAWRILADNEDGGQGDTAEVIDFAQAKLSRTA